MSKKYTSKDIISILKFSKGKDIPPKEILKEYNTYINNRLELDDEKLLENVGIFEHTLSDMEGRLA